MTRLSPANPAWADNGRMRCLVTGATGYMGGRLVPRLLAQGYDVRCLARSAGRLRDEAWADQVEVVDGRPDHRRRPDEALDDVDVAYYLVHSLGQPRVREADREAARIRRGRRAGPASPHRLPRRARPGTTAHLSAHLRSRAEVGAILLGSECRRGAAGRGDHRLRLGRSRCCATSPNGCRSWSPRAGCEPHPADRRSATCCATWSPAPGCPAEVNRGFDIGGGDVLTYAEMMRRYAAVAGLRPRRIVPVRLSPRGCPPAGSDWSPRCPTASPGRWWRVLIHEAVSPSTTSPSTSPIRPRA